MATAFTVTVMPSGGDYSTLNAAMVANECNLTAAATKVFAHSAITGTMSDNTAVTGLTSGATGTCVHCSATQILIKSIVGTFQSGEIVYETLSVNLVTINDAGASPYLNLSIDGTWSSPDTTAVTITGYTTSATNYINIATTATARHNGTVSQGYMLYVTGGNCLQTGANYIYITGLIVKVNQVHYAGYIGIYIGTSGAGAVAYVSKNIVLGDGSTTNRSNSHGIHIQRGTGYIWNNIIYNLLDIGNNGSGIVMGAAYTINAFIYNNTIYSSCNGITGSNATTPVLKNNLCTNNSNKDYNYSVTLGTSSTNNLSGDGTCPALGTYYANATVTFVNAAGGNFNLASNDTGATGKGADLSADANQAFPDDIIGTTRTVPWDIGAFKAPVSATGIMNLKTGWWGDL